MKFNYEAAVGAYLASMIREDIGPITDLLFILSDELQAEDPSLFTPALYGSALSSLLSKRDLPVSSLRSVRINFNRFLHYLLDTTRVSAPMIPFSVVEALEHLQGMLTHDQVVQLVEHSKLESNSLDPFIAKLFYLNMMTGLPVEQFLRLRRGEVDHIKGVLHILPPEQGPIPVWEEKFERYLLDWMERSEAEQTSGVEDWLFPSGEGGPFHPIRFARLFRDYLIALNLPTVPLRDLRLLARDALERCTVPKLSPDDLSLEQLMAYGTKVLEKR